MTPAERIARLKELAEKAPPSFSDSTHHSLRDMCAFYDAAISALPWLLECNENLRASNERNGRLMDAGMAEHERMSKTLRDHGFVRRGKIESDVEAAISQCRQRERDAFERGARAMREAAFRVALDTVEAYAAAPEDEEDGSGADSFETIASVAADIAVSIEALPIPQDSDHV